MAFELNSEKVNLYPSRHRNRWNPLRIFFQDCRSVLKPDNLGREIAQIAFPAALALTADPLASLIDTAFIGRIGTIGGPLERGSHSPNTLMFTEDSLAEFELKGWLSGPVELAAVGVSIAIFNQVSKVFNFPLVSVTTSLVAEEDATIEMFALESPLDIEKPIKESLTTDEKEVQISTTYGSESKGNTAKVNMTLGSTVTESSIEKRVLPSVSSALVIGGALGILQAFILILGANPILNIMGVSAESPMQSPAVKYLKLRALGAPAVVISLATQGVFRGFKDTMTPLYATGLLLLARVTAVTFCLTLAASMAARQGPVPMAAFQICMQIWMATSLLADALALAGQAILATAFAKADLEKARSTAARTLQMGMVLGIFLAMVLGGSLHFLSKLFTKDIDVLKMTQIGIPFVAATQPLNAMAFVFDGINFGASDFAYAAYTMVSVSIFTILCLLVLSPLWGFVGIWVGLTILMTLRMLAGVWRIGTATGPWRFLKNWEI
ncbi:protein DETOXIFICATION 42 isoform X3 [Cryptomeria japonica]|uniref:protein DETOXIFICATION 42 isoform X3 n=1 Tax=Cryptomeria japonica TaxID=3369 RepID=UPI0027DA9658|nr:protein DETOXIFICATION 42 isoform X3 [Cryptomeria japonica]